MVASHKRRELSKRARQIIAQFDNSAQYWGWQEDQGRGGEVRKAEKMYKLDLQALERFVRSLENRLHLRTKSVIQLKKFMGGATNDPL